MKTNTRLFFFLIFAFLSFFEASSQDKMHTIKITNLESVRGDLYIGWYTNPTDFRVNEKATFREKIQVDNQNEIEVQFANIPYGIYAIAVFLDENNNYKLDKNFIGIPSEKYGFSNNILPVMRAATFQESAFELSRNESLIQIDLISR